MAILANRVKTKNNFLELAKFTFLTFKKFSIVCLIFTCAYLLYFPADNVNKFSLEISGRILSVGSMVTNSLIGNISAISDRLFYFKNLEAENRILKLKLAELKEAKAWATNIQTENAELRKLLNVTTDIKYNIITSRLIGVNITPLSSSAIIEAGSENGVKIDDLIINHDGLIGRVIGISDNYSSIMLLSDPNSRVPVITASSKARGILAKQGDSIKLIYLPEDQVVEIGELVYTSGDGKIYPYGLPVGQIYKIDNEGIFVKLSANLNSTEFIRVESRP